MHVRNPVTMHFIVRNEAVIPYDRVSLAIILHCPASVKEFPTQFWYQLVFSWHFLEQICVFNSVTTSKACHMWICFVILKEMYLRTMLHDVWFQDFLNVVLSHQWPIEVCVMISTDSFLYHHIWSAIKVSAHTDAHLSLKQNRSQNLESMTLPQWFWWFSSVMCLWNITSQHRPPSCSCSLTVLHAHRRVINASLLCSSCHHAGSSEITPEMLDLDKDAGCNPESGS